MESLADSDTPTLSVSDGTITPVDEEPPSQAVKVALHIRPLIEPERLQGCKDCITVIPGEPQVQIGSHSFRFDHIYGSTGTSSSDIFEECVVPLVEGLFHGYNATVLAYGQTGSGKTYTMGTGYSVGGSIEGVIPQVMEMVFSKIDSLKSKAEFQLRVSFIEILKEKVHDLLDPNFPSPVKSEMPNGFGLKPCSPTKPLIQIRETLNGGIILAGVTEVDVRTLDGMTSCVEQGALCRATASTNMNSCSSRSHAIFTITVEQRRKCNLLSSDEPSTVDDGTEDFLCAKLHLVDLAGSERVKRTGANGLRFKEGVHINKGLLALGNVISALGDKKKRKEGGHVPYRDSKLTRLLQDSLGGNSRTVMIACVSPADSNAEETLNTLKYANRARNIQNKPVVNHDPLTAEIQRMRNQLELLQAELLCIRVGGGLTDETKMLKQKITWLETTNAELRQDLQESRNKLQVYEQDALDVQGAGLLQSYANRVEELENELHQLRNTVPQATTFSTPCIDNKKKSESNGELSMLSEDQNSLEVEDEKAAKELEHNLLQNSMDKELQDLNKRLQLKKAEMKTFVNLEKQPLKNKLLELEEEKKALQKERDALLSEVEALAAATDEQTQMIQESYLEKLEALESQIAVLKKREENQSQILKQKQQSEEAAKRLQEEIQRIKVQKVQVQHKMKQESELFRQWKSSREKELLQLRKEGRKNEYEMLKLQALTQCQKMVLHRKTEEAAIATRRLKELLDDRKTSPRESTVSGAAAATGSASESNEKVLGQWLEHELEVAVHIHEVRSSCEKQTESRSALAKELSDLKDEEKIQLNAHKDVQDRNSLSCSVIPASSTSSDARQARISLLESMLNSSSCTLVAMASQLSEAEEQERALSGRGRWQHLKTIGDAKNLLQSIFSAAAYARCQLWDKDLENKELKEKITDLTELLRQSEAQQQEMDKQRFLREQLVAKALTTSSTVGLDVTMTCSVQELSTSLLQSGAHGPRQQQYSDYFYDFSTCRNNDFPYDLCKVVSVSPKIGARQASTLSGKFWRWKRSYQRWLLQFKWKWQKPWRLSEWARHGEDTMTGLNESRV